MKRGLTNRASVRRGRERGVNGHGKAKGCVNISRGGSTPVLWGLVSSASNEWLSRAGQQGGEGARAQLASCEKHGMGRQGV